ncbi:hypothetical protein [Streptomyces niveus]|uniref:hypothetical protein n=1 Tax=Streptomyces niveus TaxID=193462 RepID=UPI002E29ED4F|nr:hypothetical protein [Streptomyces niveus]
MTAHVTVPGGCEGRVELPGAHHSPSVPESIASAPATSTVTASRLRRGFCPFGSTIQSDGPSGSQPST